MKLRKILSVAWLMLFCMNAGTLFAAEAEQKKPVAVFPEKIFEFAEVLDGKDVVHDFVVQNTGDAVLKIEKVDTT